MDLVTPCVGVWIEIVYAPNYNIALAVTPCVGVWIEIKLIPPASNPVQKSLPAWECGLKLKTRRMLIL